MPISIGPGQVRPGLMESDLEINRYPIRNSRIKRTWRRMKNVGMEYLFDILPSATANRTAQKK